MVITIVGSVHPKCAPEELVQFISNLLERFSAHTLVIEERFGKFLAGLGLPLSENVSLQSLSAPLLSDLLITFGGDGTLLRAAKLTAGGECPILGVNTGRLGFLASLTPHELEGVYDEILAGRYDYEERSLLEVSLGRAPSTPILPPALNEIAILKRDTASMISLRAMVDGEYIATFEGDGLLVSTPTGSTAYALSVGGAIVHPHAPTLSISPIAPHTLNMRPLIIPDHVVIELKVSARNGTFLLSSDGKSLPLQSEETLLIRKSSKSVRLVVLGDHSYFNTLRQKLMWGKDARESEV